MSHVPDYRGMFLRGVGSQADHASSKLGEIQNDTIRNVVGYLGQQQFSTFNGPDQYGYYGQTDNVFYYTTGSHQNGQASFPRSWSGYSAYDFSSSNFSDGWYDALTKYRYTLSGDNENGYTLIESAEHPTLRMFGTSSYLKMDLSLQVPTSNEVRPINIGVRYLMKAG